MTARPSGIAGARLRDDQHLSRVIGRVNGREAGPTLICVAGIHGNEPAGVEALKRAFRRLQAERGWLRGELVGLAGNLPALALGRRYVAKDLNRQWLPERAESTTAATEPDASPEDQERREILGELERVFARARGDVFVLDIHTTSGDGSPFVVMGDTLRNRSLALQFPVPIILGLEEHLDGTLSEYLTNRGYVTITIEAGQHDSPDAIEQAEAAVWLALGAIGALDGVAAPWLNEARARLRRRAGSLPRVLEVCHRHPVMPGSDFRMEPGFDNLQHIQVGQLLARDRNGEIHSKWNARLLMPLYQELGNDGFFVVREFKPIWLKVSTLLRHLRLDAIAHWLPGISRHPSRPDTLVVDRRVARWRSLELLHLLGFRKRRSLGDLLLVSRRRHDINRRRRHG